MTDVTVVIGAGSIGQAIARRVSTGKHVLLADLRQETADAAAKVLADAGFDVTTTKVDVASRESVKALVELAVSMGDITGVIHAAGVSPSQAPPATILHVDLYGTALVLELFGDVIAKGGSAIVIASQSGHRLPPLSIEQNKALALTPTEELLALPMLRPDVVTDPLNAYQISKRCNSLRVAAQAVRWASAVRGSTPSVQASSLLRSRVTNFQGRAATAIDS
jgi:NAD(P)-dependent dehydrogenase (short-subunit alcohol dehydrogenase family)